MLAIKLQISLFPFCPDEIEIFDGAGRWARGAIAEGNEREVTVLLEKEGKVQRKGPSLFLAIAVTKGKVMEVRIRIEYVTNPRNHES